MLRWDLSSCEQPTTKKTTSGKTHRILCCECSGRQFFVLRSDKRSRFMEKFPGSPTCLHRHVSPKVRTNTDQVQTPYRCSTDAVQTQYRPSTGAVQTQTDPVRPSTDPVQTQYRCGTDPTAQMVLLSKTEPRKRKYHGDWLSHGLITRV